MFVLVLPISGGGFVTQLAILQHLCASHFIPDITLASSGGNVAAYVAAAANWKWPGIERIARGLTQSLFVSPMHTISAFSIIMGYFAGSLYRQGKGIHEFLRTCFTPETIARYEIWTGVYNKNLKKARLVCNKDATASLLRAEYIDHDLTQSIPTIFAGGDIEMISKAGIASASIPVLVPPEVIEGQQYIDGGIGAASPLTILHEPILQYVQEQDCSMHIIYVNSINLATLNVDHPCHNVFDTWRQVTDDLIRSQTVIDRWAAYNLLRHKVGSDNMRKHEFMCNYANLERLRSVTDRVRYFLLEIFPETYISITLTAFTGDDVIAGIRKAYPQCYCCLWWQAPTDTTVLGEVQAILDACGQEMEEERETVVLPPD